MSKLKGDPGYRAGWCIHFQDMTRNDFCEEGVRYSTLPNMFNQKPCFMSNALTADDRLKSCPKFRGPTQDEIVAHEAWATGRLAKTLAVMESIKPWRDAHRNESFAEVVDCAACKGKLHLSIARNGHVHGRCETDGCVSWME